MLMVFCGDSVSVGTFFYFHRFVSNCSELILVSGVVLFSFFFNTADRKSFWNNRVALKGGHEKLMAVLCPHHDAVLSPQLSPLLTFLLC